MGQTFVQLAGAMPHPDTLAWHRWVNRGVRARLLEHLWTPDMTIYVDAHTGSDAADGLTSSTPKQTLSAANTLRAANSGSRCVIYLSGRFQISAQPFASSDAIAYTRYMAWPGRTRPLITTATRTNTFTLDTGTRYYASSVTTEPAWVSLSYDHWSLGYKTTSAANCTTYGATIPNTPFSWWRDSGTNRVYFDYGNANAARYIDIIPSGQNYSCFTPNADMVSYWGITIQGFATGNTTTVSPIHADSLTGTESLLVYDCDCMGGDNHSCVLEESGTSSGGIMTVINSRAGCMTGGSLTIATRGVREALSPFNFYKARGDHEAITYNVEIPVALVPTSTWFVPGTSEAEFYTGRGPYSHTDGGAYTCGLHIFYWTPDSNQFDKAWATSASANVGNPVTPSNNADASTYNAFIVGERIVRKVGQIWGNVLNTNTGGAVRLNQVIDIVQRPGQAASIATGNPVGIAKNGFYRVNAWGTLWPNTPCLNADGTFSAPGYYENCVLWWKEQLTGRGGGWNFNAASSENSIHLRDCIHIHELPNAAVTGNGLYVTTNTVRGLLAFNYNGTGNEDITNGTDVVSWSEATVANRGLPIRADIAPSTGDIRIFNRARYGTIQYDALLRPRKNIGTFGHLAAEDLILADASKASSGAVIGGSHIGNVLFGGS